MSGSVFVLIWMLALSFGRFKVCELLNRLVCYSVCTQDVFVGYEETECVQFT